MPKRNCVKITLFLSLIIFMIALGNCSFQYYFNQKIFPGTKWCGPGNLAKNINDLGYYEETDKCCRAHDNCDHIGAYRKKYGLFNDYMYTRLNCSCDKTFFECLHKSNDGPANYIGRTYFKLANGCYRQEYPIINCTEYEYSYFDKRCIKYEFDTTKPQIYQWFDLPYYTTVKKPYFF